MKNQNGIAIFMALISLMLVSLMAAALIRSIDSNNTVIGNIGFKQVAVSSGDMALDNALTWISNNPNLLNSDSAINGYYATYDKINLVDGSIWVDGKSRLIPSVDSNGNSIRVVVERMCNNKLNSPVGDDGAARLNSCLFGAAPSDQNSVLVKNAAEAGAGASTGNSPVFRVTLQVTGLKDTVSYVQAFVY